MSLIKTLTYSLTDSLRHLKSRNLKSQCVALLGAGLLLLFGAACLEHSVWADQIHFHNGQVVTAKVTEISGDLIRYRQGLFKEFSTKRMALSDRNDRVTTWKDEVYVGEVHYIDGAKLEIITPTGRQLLWKARIKDIQLGSSLALNNTNTLPSAVDAPASRPVPVERQNVPAVVLQPVMPSANDDDEPQYNKAESDRIDLSVAPQPSSVSHIHINDEKMSSPNTNLNESKSQEMRKKNGNKPMVHFPE